MSPDSTPGTGSGLSATRSLPGLEPIAMAALDAGRVLMESGANARSVEEVVEMVARGLGAETVDLRIGYASLTMNISIGASGITRMRRVRHVGVNQQLDQKVWELARLVSRGEMSAAKTRIELVRIGEETRRYPLWLTAVAVGLACAGFGRLLRVDWPGIAPVFLAAAIGQYVRGKLLARHVNLFVCTTLVSFLCSALGGIGARMAGSETYATAMVASILLLVPGVPAVNAQRDILEGHPSLGSARLATVLMTLVFLAAGLWFGESAVDLVGKR
jgi:uncharacterized membrane protein YjjP (DUF1212 family)